MSLPTTAFILAAGLGARMRPLTDDRPKPLIELGGRPLIDYVLERFIAAGVTRFVINVHYRADQMRDHLAARGDCDIIISDETGQLLDSGGGIAKALPVIGTDPIVKSNADVIWLENQGESLITEMLTAWDPARMDHLLGLVAKNQVIGYAGPGDFEVGTDGVLTHRGDAPSASNLFMGLEILKPDLFATRPQGDEATPFSLWDLWTPALERQRMFGHVHSAPCLHITNPQSLEDAEAYLKARAGEEH